MLGHLPAELGLVGVVDGDVVLEHGEQVVGRVGGDDDVARGGGDEAFLDGPVDEGEQRVVVAVDVEEAHRLAVDAKLGPGDDLKELLQGAIPTCWIISSQATAQEIQINRLLTGERDECVGVSRHLGLPLVHPGHVLELPRRVADELPRQHRLGRDPQHVPAGVVDGAGDETHQTNAAAAVHKVDAALHLRTHPN